MSTSTTTPLFPMAEFQAGVTACLRSWSALRTAVEGGWGGTDSFQKADDLRNNILSVMNGQTVRPLVEQEDLEDNLAIYMEEEFSVQLEDNSERQVAATLFRLYEECVQGNTALAESLVNTALIYEQQVAGYPVQIQSTEHDDDDDDDDDAMMDATTDANANANDVNDIAIVSQTPQLTTVVNPTPTTTTVGVTSAAEYAAQSLFGKPRPPKAPRKRDETPQVTMDEDGFATVTKTKRKPRP